MSCNHMHQGVSQKNQKLQQKHFDFIQQDYPLPEQLVSEYKHSYLQFFRSHYDQVQVQSGQKKDQVQGKSMNLNDKVHDQLQQKSLKQEKLHQYTKEEQKYIKQQNNKQKHQQQQNLQFLYNAKIAQTRKKLYQQLKLNGFKIQLQQQRQIQKSEDQQIKNQKQNKKPFRHSFQNHFEENLQINLIGHTQNFQIIQLQCKLGAIQKHIKIINVNEQSSFHQHPPQFFGSMGNIYFKQIQMFDYKKFCIKCIKFNDRIRKSQFLMLAIKQYFINMIMGALNISPQVLMPFAFNLIVFEDCIEFHTQICQKVIDNKSFTIQQIQKDLKAKLLKMHALKIIHMDIKPQNIVFRQKDKKIEALFIDFGLSRCINQISGYKSYVTNFCGTIGYTSQQMMNLLLKSKEHNSFIDLYHNDIESFRKTFQCIRNYESRFYSKIFDPVIVYSCQKQCYLLLLKYFLLDDQVTYINQLLKYIDFDKIDNFHNKICNFLSFIPISSRSHQILCHKFKKLYLFHRQKYFLVQKGIVQPILLVQNQNNNIKMVFQGLYGPLINRKDDFLQYFITIQETNLVRAIILNKQNVIQFIKKNSNEAYYEIYLRFISYWNNACHSSLQERELASQIFKQTINIQLFPLQMKIANLIFSKNPYSFKSYQNLIFSIKYLLNYCFQNPVSYFSSSNYGTIVQQSLMLGLDFGQHCIFLMKQSFLLKLSSLYQANMILKFFISHLPFYSSILKYTSDNKLFQINKNRQQLLQICLKQFYQGRMLQNKEKQLNNVLKLILKVIPIVGNHKYTCEQHRKFGALVIELGRQFHVIKKDLSYKNYETLFNIVGMCFNQVLRNQRIYNYQSFNRQNIQHYAFKQLRKIKNEYLIIIQDFYKLQFLISSFEYKELSKQIQILDYKINDSQISQLIKPQYRIVIAHYANDSKKLTEVISLINAQNFPNLFNYSKNIYILRFSLVSIINLRELSAFNQYLSIFQNALNILTQQLLYAQQREVRYYFDKVTAIIRYYFSFSSTQYKKKRCEMYFKRIELLQTKINTQNCSLYCQRLFLTYYKIVEAQPEAYLNTCIKIFQNKLFHTIQLTQLCHLIFSFLQHNLDFSFDQLFHNLKNLFKISIFSHGGFLIQNNWFSVILFQFFLQRECFKSICTFYRLLIENIRKKPSQQNIYKLMEILKECHNQNWISIIFRKYYAKFLTSSKRQKLQKLTKYLIVVNYAWQPFVTPRDSLIYLNIFQYSKSQQERNFLIVYITKCRPFLISIDNRCICQKYYYLASELKCFSQNKKKKLLKKHVKVSHFLYSRQYIFLVNGVYKKNRISKISNIFNQKIKEKIIKYHINFQNIFDKKQEQQIINQQKNQFFQKVKEQKQMTCNFLTNQKKKQYKITIKSILEKITKSMAQIFSYETINKQLIDIFAQEISE